MVGIPSGLGGAFLAGNACDPYLPLRGMGSHGGCGADTAGGGLQPEGAVGANRDATGSNRDADILERRGTPRRYKVACVAVDRRKTMMST